MLEEFCFQEIGVRKDMTHIIDPSVVIQIQQAIIANADKEALTGVLFGKQQANNLAISAVLIVPTGTLKTENEFKRPENFQTLLKYYEKVLSLSFVGLFARKQSFDRECYIQNSYAFEFKTTTDFVFLTGDYDSKTSEFSFTAYSSLRNKYFKEIFMAFQKVPYRIDFLEENYPKSLLNSYSGYIFHG